jgi:thioredoxin reductase (NADPH)
VHGPHRFLGEINLLTGSPPYLTAVVRDPGEVLRVAARRLRELVAEDEELSNLILRAFMSRRSILIDLGAGVKVVGSRFSQDSRRVREFLARNRMSYQWMDVAEDEEAEALLCALGVAAADTPVVISGHGVSRNPSNADVAALLGLGSRGAPPAMCDVVIVGAGPAGLAAAVYGASEGLDTQVIDAVAFGGQASTSARIENYLGFPTGISGSELAERTTLQARRFGARMVVPAEAAALRADNGHYAIELADGSTVNSRAVIVATGAQYRKLELPELERYEAGGGVLRGHPGRGAPVRGRSGADRGRRQRGRPGCDVPLPARLELPPCHPRRRPRHVDVALPDRRARAKPARGALDPHRDRPAQG